MDRTQRGSLCHQQTRILVNRSVIMALTINNTNTTRSIRINNNNNNNNTVSTTQENRRQRWERSFGQNEIDP
jgi:hypothetical protein